MKIGFVYPQTEFGNDPGAIRALAQTAEELGFSHVLTYEHVLGVNPDQYENWNGPYDYRSGFQSPFLLFSYMAAVTERLEFTTGILILPQRQTALVAKQAATLDILSKGRLKLGIGIGWNKPEYTALGENFHDRGRRVEEQVKILRELWTQPLVNFSGQWHNITGAGINPLPVQQPIPIWFGGHAEAVLRRAATMGDGWMPGYRSAEAAQPALAKLDSYLSQAGRSRPDFGIEARILYEEGDPIIWQKTIEGWRAVGVTHISFNTMQAGFDNPGKHLKALQFIAANFDIESG